VPLDASRAQTARDLRFLNMVMSDEVDVRPV